LRIVFDRLTSSEGVAVEPKWDEQGRQYFPQMPTGRVRLQGHVLWADREARNENASLEVRVFVNGFQQLPRPVQPPPPGELKSPFRADILLNLAAGNHIRLGIPAKTDKYAECVVDCAKPITGQRLHVLALSSRSSPKRVKEQILAALNAPEKDGKKKRVIEDENVYPPASRSRAKLSRFFILRELENIRDKIVEKQQKPLGLQDEPMNDVLLIYYEGGESINNEGHFFETQGGSAEDSPFDMKCVELVDRLSTIPGAHVLLLDVERRLRVPKEEERNDKIEYWKETYATDQAHVVVMRCARQHEQGKPGEIRLIPVLQQTIPQANRLKELVALVKQVLDTSAEREPLIFRSFVPDELANLSVGSRP
jgi:hypothetical protein